MRVIDDRRNLDALCDKEHGLSDFLSLDARDRSLARAIVVSALRHRNTIDAVLGKVMDRSPPKRARFLIHSLHIAISQILFLDVPETAAVDLAVTAIGDNSSSSRFRSLANAVLRRVVREQEQFLDSHFKVPASMPPWLASALRRDYGKANLEKISRSLTTLPKLDLTVKTDAEGWANRLGGVLLPTGSVRLETGLPVSELEGFEDGNWWVQDTAASIPARLLGCEEGADVLELCAAPGGKTAQLINLGYDVTALDISAPRIKRLEGNLARLGMSANLVNSDILEWKSEKQFDAVLLDAPCSSTGTVRRHPDVMWTKSPEDVSELAALQYRLIEKALEFVRPGGTLVFSNCSMLKEEGEDIFARLLDSHQNIKSVPVAAKEVFGMTELINGQGAVRSLPFHLQLTDRETFGGMDGFFASRIAKSP